MISATSVSAAPRLLLVHHVARRLGVPRRTVRCWAATGRLPAIKIGPKIWKFRPEDVEAFALTIVIVRRRRSLRPDAV
jgi:excisionase family DNA binding protein